MRGGNLQFFIARILSCSTLFSISVSRSNKRCACLYKKVPFCVSEMPLPWLLASQA